MRREIGCLKLFRKLGSWKAGGGQRAGKPKFVRLRLNRMAFGIIACDVQMRTREYFGQESWGKAVYQDISAPEKIVFIDMFADAEGNAVSGMPETLVKVEFIEGEHRTKLVMRSEFASEEALQQVIDMGIIQGVSSQFERLDNHLKQAY